MKVWLPKVLPELLVCSKLSEADRLNMIQTKEDDLFLERGGKGVDGDEDEEEGEEEDYTVGGGRGSANTTLRRSAAYSIGLFSKSFQEETYQVL